MQGHTAMRCCPMAPGGAPVPRNHALCSLNLPCPAPLRCPWVCPASLVGFGDRLPVTHLDQMAVGSVSRGGGVEASISSHLLFQPPQIALQTCTRPFVRALMSILKSFWVENVLTWRQPVCRPARLPALPAPAWPTPLAPLCCSLDPILFVLGMQGAHPGGRLGTARGACAHHR